MSRWFILFSLFWFVLDYFGWVLVSCEVRRSRSTWSSRTRIRTEFWFTTSPSTSPDEPKIQLELWWMTQDTKKSFRIFGYHSTYMRLVYPLCRLHPSTPRATEPPRPQVHNQHGEWSTPGPVPWHKDTWSRWNQRFTTGMDGVSQSVNSFIYTFVRHSMVHTTKTNNAGKSNSPLTTIDPDVNLHPGFVPLGFSDYVNYDL